jgi:hypothetical protein
MARQVERETVEAALCQEGAMLALGPNTCGPATRPDPRFPKIDTGDNVLCEDCYQAALDEMAEEIEALR